LCDNNNQQCSKVVFNWHRPLVCHLLGSLKKPGLEFW